MIIYTDITKHSITSNNKPKIESTKYTSLINIYNISNLSCHLPSKQTVYFANYFNLKQKATHFEWLFVALRNIFLS